MNELFCTSYSHSNLKPLILGIEVILQTKIAKIAVIDLVILKVLTHIASNGKSCLRFRSSSKSDRVEDINSYITNSHQFVTISNEAPSEINIITPPGYPEHLWNVTFQVRIFILKEEQTMLIIGHQSLMRFWIFFLSEKKMPEMLFCQNWDLQWDE